MDSLSTIHKIQAVRYKKQQFMSSLVLYTLTTMSCSLLVFSPFWYPPLRATVNVSLYVSFPKVLSLFLSAKAVFIVGNLIVIFLVGEFKIYTVPHPSQAHGARGQILRSPDKERGNPEIALEEKGQNVKMNLHRMITGTNKVSLKHEKTSGYREGCSEQNDHREELMPREKDLNKMADDFIARVNKQRRLEAELYKY